MQANDMIDNIGKISSITEKNLSEVNTLYLKCQSLLVEQEYEKVSKIVPELQQSLMLVFEDEDFKNSVFINQSLAFKSHQKLLISVNTFLDEEVINLTLLFENIKSELTSMKTADKMKKAYGA
ncbi:MAG: hypothetical protein KC484_05560 [Colwelliaceae bacterium]|nr:hypothetical protein [Colwelliaceae bacterium]